MSTISSTSSQHLASVREQRAREVVRELAERRVGGELIADDDALAQHIELLPELSIELAKLRSITEALATVDEATCIQAWERLEADWLRDESIDSEVISSHGPHVDSEQVVARVLGRDLFSTSTAGDRLGVRRGSRDVSERLLARIGRFQVRGLLGQGGFGSVYLGWDQELKRHVAVKVPHRDRISAPQDIEAYLTEARVIASLDHPGIVPVYDVGRTEDAECACFVVTKLIPGENLATRLKRVRVDHRTAAQLVAQVAAALHCAHTQGLVHRDVKPANILLDDRDRPYVSDFGLALRDVETSELRSYAGTPAYMSPEQARGESHRVDGRSDIFSLGVVLYEMLTGRKPFRETSYESLLQEIIEKEVVLPRQIDATIPLELERICLKALAKRAADRYATARDMAEDLEYLIEQLPESGDAPPASDHPPTLPEHLSPIVPKGLRSFDANDASFFLELLPGPRDRLGIPESLRQWKLRIEATDVDESFAVGLIYGPSGCGKSSLVRAGLLPLLSPDIQTVYIEATVDDTEARLLQKLHKLLPSLGATTSLASCLAQIRRGRASATAGKLLLVIDQFEQWLHGRHAEQRRALVEALRHCDGEHLQCLLLVRDDFWLALSRFMAEVEVDLIQGRNAALVDLFAPSHARHVLTEFGRALGRLPPRNEALSPAEDEFLSQAITDLVDDEKVIPVRLALFAEMVKGRSWTPATLRELGGASGVGLAFLEETFSARSGNLQTRVHEQAARAVLEALLPEPGSNIKGHVRAYPELLDISGYEHNPRAFKDLMRILDSETRLLTPVDSESDSSEVALAPGRRFYQLTHDYLVPSLREWLTRRQKATPVGRAELRLAERATMWHAYRERRQLPSLWEWLMIRLLTRPAQWTLGQRRMMATAARQHSITAALAGALVLAFLLAGSELTMQARDLLVKFRASTASIWLALGQDNAIWSLLHHDPDPTLRTQLIHDLKPLFFDAEGFLRNLTEQDDVSTQRAMMLLMGELASDPPEDGTLAITRASPSPTLINELLRLLREDPDRGMHAATQWTLWRYGQAAESASILRRSAAEAIEGDRQWYVSKQGHTMVVIPGPAEFQMGSPFSEASRGEDEAQRSQRIRRSFSLASKETTIAQFEQFLRDNPTHPRGAERRFDLDPDTPQTSVSWFEAAAYCNWLSKRANLSEDQWCYLPAQDASPADNGAMETSDDTAWRIAPDYLTRSGYRLPTEAEWEYACRAGSTSAYYFGRDPAQLPHYAVCAPESASQPQRVGLRKPNDFGLFDMLGNAAEWCHDRYRDPTSRNVLGDNAFREADYQFRVVRGGSFQDAGGHLRSAARRGREPHHRDFTIGFRVARSYP